MADKTIFSTLALDYKWRETSSITILEIFVQDTFTDSILKLKQVVEITS